MLYFANGILQAESLTWNYGSLSEIKDYLPKSFMSAMKADYDSSATLHQHKRTKEYGLEVVPSLKAMRKQEKIIAEKKQLLADTDYVDLKRAEGKISDDEWTKSCTDRDSWRKDINSAEVLLEEATTRYQAIRSKYAATQTREERFKAANARDNACLQDLIDFYKDWKNGNPPEPSDEKPLEK